MAEKELRFRVASIFGAQHQRGLVHVQWGELDLMLTPAEIRGIALNLLQAAEAAVGDEMLVRAMRAADLDDPTIFAMLRLFRNACAEYEEFK